MKSASARIAQFSDLHLVGKPGTACKGIDTWAQLTKMLASLSSQEPVDGLVLTGDIAHDEKRETYAHLKDMLDTHQLPYWVIPGNHDSPEFIREVFSGRVDPEVGSACFSATLQGCGLIGLDTHEPGSDGGILGEATMRWFKQELTSLEDKPVLVFMHHPPLNTGDAFFDSIGLANRDEWFELAKSYPQINGIGYGHLHKPMRLYEKPWVQGAPSTAFGMVREAEKLVAVKEQAGYLIWAFNEGELSVEVLVDL